MAVRIVVHNNPTFVEAVYEGVMSTEELDASSDEIVSLLERNGTTLVLSDCSAIQGNGFDSATLSRHLERLQKDLRDLRVRDAIVLRIGTAVMPSTLFWETACLNCGVTARLFADRQSALEWLLHR